MLLQKDYNNIDTIASLYRSFNILEKMSKKGDTVANAILIDLTGALVGLEAGEKHLINELLIQGFTFREYSNKYNITLSKAHRDLRKALNKVSVVLND